MRVVFFIFALFSALFSESIKEYNVDVTIKPDAEVEVTEDIVYNFENSTKHGIYRDIPVTIKYKNRVIDLGFYDFKVLLNNSSVNYEKSIFYSKLNGKNIRLKIGSKNSLVTGIQKYSISYKIKKMVLPYSKYEDIISFNAIGTSWRVPIKKATITYTLPSTLHKDNITIKTFTGEYGSITTKAKIKWIDNYKFKLLVDRLPPFHGVTIDLIFNRGALGQNGNENVKTDWINIVLNYLYLIIFIPIALYLKRVYKEYVGFIDTRSIAVMYEPPKDISTLQAGLILDTLADNKDYAAAILELAHKGYIKIEQNQKDQIVLHATRKKRSSLEKDLKMLLQELLPTSNSDYFFIQKDPQEAKNLRSIFEKINSKIYEIGVEKGFFKESPYDSKKSFLKKVFFITLPYLAYFIYYIFSKMGSEGLIIILFPLIFSSAGVSIILKGGLFNIVFGLIFAVAGISPLFSNAEAFGGLDKIILGPIGVMIVLQLFVIYLYKNVGRYTQKGAMLKNQLLGLQEFIKRVKKDEIAYRLKSDPLYLERLLPYALLFGETKHWIALFGSFNMPPPTWYDGDVDYLSEFDSSINSSANYVESSSSSSGGFGGSGGSSGGGGGGGGGGSW